MKTRYEMTENAKENEVLECPNHRDDLYLETIKENKRFMRSCKVTQVRYR